MKGKDTCGQHFGDLIDSDDYYVDKTLLIRDLLDRNKHGIYLFVRPRGFGKTTNLSMMDAFFNIEYKGNRWFDGLEISKYPEYVKFKNAFPVIRLDLGRMECTDVDSFYDSLGMIIADVYRKHDYLLESDCLRDYEKPMFAEITECKIERVLLQNSIPQLCRMLEEHHGKGVVILIDDYDHALSDESGLEYRSDLTELINSFLSPILKNNENIQMAFVTGLMPIADDSLFPGLNNVLADTVFSDRYAERFGFTESEVRALLSYHGHPEKFDEAKEWYGGYRFGDAELFNPFALMRYVSDGFVPRSYWADSGSDLPMEWLLRRTDLYNFTEILAMFGGDSYVTRLYSLYSRVTEIRKDGDLYRLMIFTGCLSATPTEDECYSLSIPNRDVMSIVGRISNRICHNLADDIREFNTNAYIGDADRMSLQLQKIFGMNEKHDLPPDTTYEVFLMAVLCGMMPSYDVKAERESGSGELDIMMTPKEGTVPIAMGVTEVSDPDGLESAAVKAMERIRSRIHHDDTVDSTILMGLSFCGMESGSVTEVVCSCCISHTFFINDGVQYDIMKQIDTCGLSFPNLRKGNKYYVDKTLLIKDILDTNDNGVYLFTRPRRFGKTTNLSMLDAFFNIKYKGNTWFDELEISKYPEYEKFKNAFPVVFINLKDTKSNNKEFFVEQLKYVLKKVFMEHYYLLRSDVLMDFEREFFNRVLREEVPEMKMINCIPELCEYLHRYHGKNVIILIDEYDRAVSDAFGEESHREIMDFLGSFLSPILKNNENVQMAYVTGIMQITKESIFSGLNNLKVNNLFSEWSDERFGFTESEVKELLAYYDHPEKFDEAKEWYDGYRFGNAEVYNPFSIMNYVSEGFVPKLYWVNSGSDVPIKWLLERTNIDNFTKILTLVDGGNLTMKLDTSMTYSKIDSTKNGLYNLMVLAGYLKAVPAEDGKYSVSIPNKEIMGVVGNMSEDICPVDTESFAKFNRAILDGDADKISSELQDILSVGSYYNLTTELHYEAVLMTILYEIIPSYDVRSDSESGNGRVDIILTPKKEGTVPIIMELKKVDSESELDSAASGAIDQIHEKKYYLNMHGKVILVGLAFWGKMPKAVIETIRNP